MHSSKFLAIVLLSTFVVGTYAQAFTCTAAGTFPDPVDTSVYYRCLSVGGILYRYRYVCPAGTHFNPTRLVCVAGVGPTTAAPTTEAATTVAATTEAATTVAATTEAATTVADTTTEAPVTTPGAEVTTEVPEITTEGPL